MGNEKNHLYGPSDFNKDRKDVDKKRTQQQFSRFSAASSSNLNTVGNEPKSPALQIDTKVQIGDPYDDTKGSVGASTQILNFNVFGSNYTFYEVTGDVDFTFGELPTGRHIEFVLDILVNQVAGVTLQFPQVANPPVLAGNDGDRYILKFVGVNRTDPDGATSPVQTFTFITGGGTASAGANTALSNLIAPTAINVTLVPDSAGTLDLGTDLLYWDVVKARGIEFLGSLSSPTAASGTRISRDSLGIMEFNVEDASNKYIFYFDGVAKWDMSQTSLTGSNIILSNILTLNDNAGDPLANGQFARNVADVKVFSGGAVRNLSDIIVGGGANKQLSNLGVTAINADLLFASGNLDVGDSTNPVDGLFAKRLILETGSLTFTDAMIVGDASNHIEYNVPTGAQHQFKVNGVTIFDIDSSNMSGNNIILSNSLVINDSSTNPSAGGEFTRDGDDVKVFSGGAIRNLTSPTFDSIIISGLAALNGDVSLGNAATDDITWTGTLQNSILFTEITTPANPAANKMKLYVKDNGGTSEIYVLDSAGTETSLMGGGGSQTPWTSQIDADENNLVDLGHLQFFDGNTTLASALTPYIQYFDTTIDEMVFNVPTGDIFTWRVNGSVILTLNNTGILTMTGSINMASNDITSVDDILMSGTGSVIDMGGGDIIDLDRLEFANSTSQAIETSGGSMDFLVPTGDEFEFKINSTNKFQITASQNILYDSSGNSCTTFSGRFEPVVDNSINLGSSSFRWIDVWAVDGTINTSFSEYKENIREVDIDDMLALALEMKPIIYNWKRDNPKTMEPFPNELERQTIHERPQDIERMAQDYLGYLGDPLIAMPEALRNGDGISQASVEAVTLGAIQSLYNTITLLKERIATLESSIA